jgi:glutamate synthase (NADPH/NADH) small chain
MADPRGFLTTPRQVPARRPVDVRIQDWREVYLQFGHHELEAQAGRCMDCGIPFCHQGCPLGNLIPEWNDLVRTGEWRAAAERLHATNNFPEFTGRLCPAPCESACVLGINADPVTIKQVEVEIINRAWEEGWVPPRRPSPEAIAAGRRVAVIGSGPSGLAAAQQLTRAGHAVTVYERADAPGGLLRYGIPEFKMEKSHLDRRLVQMLAEGTEFRCGVAVGDQVTAAELRRDFDAVVLACGATIPRGLPVPGGDLDGVYQAMDFLPLANRAVAAHREAVAHRDGEDFSPERGAVPHPHPQPPAAPGADLEIQQPAISARGRHVVIIGGGDTGADCLGTALRQGAASVTQLEILPRPPEARPASAPWPTYPMIYRVSSAHEEGGDRVYAVSTQEFLADESGRVRALRLIEVELDGGTIRPQPGTERDLPCDLVLLAMGFTGAERGRLVTELGVEITTRGNVARDADYTTSVPGVFVAGDMGRGQSLIVWAIAEGRSAAAAVDRYLSGDSVLPTAIEPTATSLR